jgi:hypothetical protein
MRDFRRRFCLPIHFYTSWQFFLFLLYPLQFRYDWHGPRFSSNANTDSHGHPDSNGYGETYGNTYSNSNSHSNGYCNSGADTNARTQWQVSADAKTSPDTSTSPVVPSHGWKRSENGD